MNVAGLEAFHIGLVVHSVDAVSDLYGRILGVQRWHVHKTELRKPPWDDSMTDSRFKIAYGRAAGQTIELVEVLDGRSQYSQFLEAHGEGVQHIGFWCADVRAAVETAVAEGAVLVAAHLDDDRRAVVQLTPGRGSADLLGSISPTRWAYLYPGVANVQLEFCGPDTGRTNGLRDFLRRDHGDR
jgi:catechol 2,3-dioxygenase-like lactoylglutathione lyase family enzyme